MADRRTFAVDPAAKVAAVAAVAFGSAYEKILDLLQSIPDRD